MRFLKAESYLKGVIFSTGLNILAKGIAFLNTLIIAHYFGSNASTDIYFAVISVALIVTTVINGIDLLVLIPESMRLREQADEHSAQKFLNFFILSYLIIGIFLIGFIIISPTFFYSLFTGFDSNFLLQKKWVLYGGGLIIFFQIINNLLNSILTSYKFFTMPILTGLVNSLLSITVTVLFNTQLGIEGTVFGLCLGFFINFILLIFVFIKYQRWKFFRVVWIKNKHVWQNILMIQVSILPIWLRNAAGLYLLSGLGDGIITSVNLGQQLSAMPETLILSQLLAVSGIKFSEAYSQKNLAELNNIFLKLSEWGLYITTFIGAVFFLFANEIVRIIYAGSGMSEVALKNIELTFCFFILCLPVKFNAALCTNILTASQNIRSTFGITIITHTTVTVLTVVLITYFGLIGYLIGVSIHFYLFLFIFYPIMAKVMPAIKYFEIFKMFAGSIFNNAFAYLIVFAGFHFGILNFGNVYLKVITGFTLFTLFVIIANEFTNANKHLKIKKIYIYAKRKLFAGNH